ncbi:hypothetical protein [Porphyromonas sp.]|uniref:hypothetical protein n=1 Tax=Porphyromonas sp. TaxID=1924944 RepID=UPI0026DCD0DF|nr:hypothetical protein [Porphyromonas sp.]MDO4695815.1 hypothetical protein [Porphyromonas sp.]MDO4771415.1 hypothetical protein [Porphyromonas sp.]
MKIKIWALLVASLICFGSALSQEVRVLPSLERNEMRIGEQVNMKVRIVHDKSVPVRLILPVDTLVSGVEILGYAHTDSLDHNDRIRESIYNVVITSFDSAMYVLRNIQALVGDSLYSANEAPKLLVNTVPVDVSNPEQFNDIKRAWRTPFVWRDYILPVGLFLLSIILFLAGYRIWKYLTRPKVRESELITEPEKEPYEEAIDALENLKNKGLWEKNLTKEYYTELSDILRRYIYRVWGIATFDRTTTEILETFKIAVDKGHSYVDLKKVLSTADLVKFAKYIPVAQDNIGVFNTTEAFVNRHKPLQEPSVDAVTPENN